MGLFAGNKSSDGEKADSEEETVVDDGEKNSTYTITQTPPCLHAWPVRN